MSLLQGGSLWADRVSHICAISGPGLKATFTVCKAFSLCVSLVEQIGRDCKAL